MARLLFLLVLIGLAVAGRQSWAQDIDPDSLTIPNAHRDTFLIAQPQPFKLQPFVIEGTELLRINEVVLDTAAYRLDARRGQLWVPADSFLAIDTLIVYYRTLPLTLDSLYRSTRIVNPDTLIEDAPGREALSFQAGIQRRQDPFGMSGLRRSGSITRGIVAGNQRDVSVESGLRLQLAGEVTEGVDVRAVLTDENTPIQPEGTTQQLNEFDQVFIEIKSQAGVVELGDFALQYDRGTFTQFNRKLQGVHVAGDLGRPDGGAHIQVDVAGAASRGIFHAQVIAPIDGMQGPYRLEGQQGEQFIIVIAGSETVYLDGVALTRGETNDYVIDYATGEVSFTPNRIITAQHRINVEFQYTTLQFNRTLVGSQVQASFGQTARGTPRSLLGMTFLREADGDVFDDAFGLTAEDSLRIQMAGDGLARRSGAEPVVYDPEAPFVQYTQEFRPGPMGIDTIFVAVDARPPDSVAVFRVRFTRVGAGQGRYVRVGRGVNGILYEFRGEGQGEYEPIRILPRPENQNVLGLRGMVEPLANIQLFGEWARSFNDENRLSALDSDDDVDIGYVAGVRVAPIPLHVGFATPGALSAEYRRQLTGAHFRSFNRIRPVEFSRQWNLSNRSVNATGGVIEAGDEQTDSGQLVFNLSEQSSIRGEYGRLQLGPTFEGTRQLAELIMADPGLPALSFVREVVQSKDRLVGEEGDWVRHRGRLSHRFAQSRFEPFIEIEHERREQDVTDADSLAPASFGFFDYRPGINWSGDQLQAGLIMSWRDEDDWTDGMLADAAQARTVQTRFDYRGDGAFSTDGSVGYRVRRFTEAFRVNEKAENSSSVLVRWNSRYQPYNRAIDINARYEAATERTPTLQEIYVRTGPELGQFVWEDANEDGAIQIDELIPERTPNEGVYVRTFIPSDTLTSIINVRARLRLNLEPARAWGRDAVGLKRFLSQVTTRTSIEVQEKSREDDLASIYLLDLSKFRSATNTLNGRLRITQDVSLFRSNRKYGLDFRFNQVRGLSELAAGEERRFNNLWSVTGRLAPSDTWGFRLRSLWERNRVGSEAFASRRYAIEGVELEPEISYNPSTAITLIGRLIWAQRDDVAAGRKASVWRVPLEFRYQKPRKWQISARFEPAFVQLEGDAVGLALFELTDGRGGGRSFLWGITSNYTINTYLRFNLVYDGRAPADAPVLHTVRMQLSALF